MKWTSIARTDVRSIIDKYQLYDRQVEINRIKMRGAGAPCTCYYNSALTFYGTAPLELTRCYCWDEQSASPRRDHFLCMGTGYLSGYQKYGYNETVISTPSIANDGITIDNNIVIQNERFILSGSTTSGNIVTSKIPLTYFKGVDRFIVMDAIDPVDNRVEYFYTVDDEEWSQISMSPYSETRLGNKEGSLNSFNIDENSEFIRFKITLRKRYAHSMTPRFNSIRFRFRNNINISNVDPRFSINKPAFLACREQTGIEVVQGEYGWKTVLPLKWWVLPGVTLRNGDIIEFLQGSFASRKYEVQKLYPHVHGPSLKILHQEFETTLIRDNKDIISAIDLLS